jgi:hypothetical protein
MEGLVKFGLAEFREFTAAVGDSEVLSEIFD